MEPGKAKERQKEDAAMWLQCGAHAQHILYYMDLWYDMHQPMGLGSGTTGQQQ